MVDKRDLDENGNSESALRDAAVEKLSKSPDATQRLKEKNPEEIIHELRVRQIELEKQNEELKRVQLEIEAARNKFQELYDFAPVGYFTLDPKGLITEVNLTGATLLGMPARKMIRRGFRHFVAPESLDQWYQHIRDVLIEEVKQTGDLRLKREEGSSFYVRVDSVRMAVTGEHQGETGETHVIHMAVTHLLDRKQAQGALQKVQQNYSELVENTNSITLRWDSEGKIIFLNKFGQTFFRYSAEELLGRNVVGTIVPETDESGRDLVCMIRDIGLHPELYVKNRNENMRKNGERVWISWTNKATFDELGNVMEILSVGNDHTDLKRAEEELRKSKDELEAKVAERTAELLESNEQLNVELSERKRAEDSLSENERKYRLLFDIAPIGIILVDTEGKILEVNRSSLEILGSPGPEATKAINMLTFPPLMEAGISDLFRICMTENRPVDTELFYTSKWGKEICLRIILTPKLTEQGYVEGCLAVTENVMPRKLAEKAQRESEARYRELFEHASDMIYTQDMEGKYTSVNHVVNMLLGYTEDEFLKLDFHDITDPEYLPIVEENFLKKVRDGVESTGPYEVLARSKNGTPIWLEIKSRLIKRGENPVGIHGIARNITSRKALEKALVQAQATYRSVVEAFDGIIHISSPDHVIEFANQRLIDRTGYDPVGEKCFKVLHGLEDVCPWCKYGKENLEETFRRERFSPTDNRWYYVVSSPFYHEDGRLSRIFLMHDLDVQKKAEAERENLREQLIQAQKMESIGTLAGGIAHDFNNLLQVIQGFSQMLLMKKNEKDRDYASLQRIIQAARSGADLVRRILAFSRRTKIEPTPLDLNHQAEHAKELLSRTIPKMIDIELILEDDLVTINADPTQVEQIFINLALNARDAMPGGGKLTIETRNVSLNEQDCNQFTGLRPGNYALLSISDTGHGMNQHTLDHIFDPFFTTKEVGKGSGLGLSMVYGIVKQHDGHITCNSQPELGTTFNIYFPATEFETESELPFVNLIPASGTETVLIVDDEEDLRELGKNILEMSGYTVLTAVNGQDALHLYKKEMNKISLVVLDMIMPIMGGKQCLEELIKVNPRVRILISSGIGSGGTKDRSLELGACGFVQKPFDVRQFLIAVRSALDKKWAQLN